MQTLKQRYSEADTETEIQADRQTLRQRYRQTDTETEIQAETNTE